MRIKRKPSLGANNSDKTALKDMMSAMSTVGFRTKEEDMLPPIRPAKLISSRLLPKRGIVAEEKTLK